MLLVRSKLMAQMPQIIFNFCVLAAFSDIQKWLSLSSQVIDIISALYLLRNNMNIIRHNKSPIQLCHVSFSTKYRPGLLGGSFELIFFYMIICCVPVFQFYNVATAPSGYLISCPFSKEDLWQFKITFDLKLNQCK